MPLRHPLLCLLALAALAAAPASAQWTRVDTNGLPSGAGGVRVWSVATTEASVFVTNGSPQALWRSDDDGGSWSRVAAVPEPASGVATVLSAQQTVLVQEGSGGGLHVSTDGGATWTARPAPPPLDVSILTLARAETAAGRSHAFIAGQNPNRLFVTHDDFATVEPALADLPVDQVISNGREMLAIPTRTTSTISYYRSADGGRTWTAVATQPLAADTAFPTRDSLFVARLTPSGTQFTRMTIYGSPDGSAFPQLFVWPGGPRGVIESSPDHSAVYFSFVLSVHGGRNYQAITAGFPSRPGLGLCHTEAGPGFNRALTSRFVYLMASCDETGTPVFSALYRHPVVGATVAGEAAPSAGALTLRVTNPARGAATAAVGLEAAADARLTLLDALGRRVALVAECALPAGETRLSVPLGGLAPGVYWLRLDAYGQQAVRALTVVR